MQDVGLIYSIFTILGSVSLCYFLVGYSLSTRLFPKPIYTLRDRLFICMPLSVLMVTCFALVLLNSELFDSLLLWCSFGALSFFSLKKDVLYSDLRALRRSLAMYKPALLIILTGVTLVLLTHYVRKTLIYYPELRVSWFYYGISLETALNGQLLHNYSQYGQLLPLANNYIGFTTFNACLLNMTALRGASFMYVISLVNVTLCVAISLAFLCSHFSKAPALVAVALLFSYPEGDGFAPRVFSHYWPEVFAFTLGIASLAIFIQGLDKKKYKLAVLSGTLFSFVYICHPVPFVLVMVFSMLVVVTRRLFDGHYLRSELIYIATVYVLAVSLSLLTPLILTGSITTLEYLRDGGRASSAISTQTVDHSLQYMSFFWDVPRSPVFNDYFLWTRGVPHHRWPKVLLTLAVLVYSLIVFRRLPTSRMKAVTVLVGFWAFCWIIGFVYYSYFDVFTYRKAGFTRFVPYTLISIVLLLVISAEHIVDHLVRKRLGSQLYRGSNTEHRLKLLRVFLALVVVAAYVGPGIIRVINDWDDLRKHRHSMSLAHHDYDWIKKNIIGDARILTNYTSGGAFHVLTGKGGFLDGPTAPGSTYGGAMPEPSSNFLHATDYFESGDSSVLQANYIDYLFIVPNGLHIAYWGMKSLSPVSWNPFDKYDHLVLLRESEQSKLYKVVLDPYAALEVYDVAIKTHSARLLDYLMAARIYTKLNQNKSAEACYRQALARSDNVVDVELELGQFYETHGRLEEALTRYQQAADACPDDTRPLMFLVKAHIAKGKKAATVGAYQEAREAFGRAAKIASNDALLFDEVLESLLNLGRGFVELELYPMVLSAYEEAVELGPGKIRTYWKLAELLDAINQQPAAQAVLAGAADRWPKTAKAQILLGQALEMQGEFEEALNAYKRAIELAPRWPPSYQCLGNLYYSLGRINDAVSLFQAAARGNRKEAWPYIELGKIYLEQSRSDYQFQ